MNTSHPRETFRDVAVKVHVRKPDKDSWVYLGRGIVSSEMVGRSNRIRTYPLLSGCVSLAELCSRLPSREVYHFTKSTNSVWRGACIVTHVV